MDQEKIGSLILKLRKEKKLTQKEVAEALQVSDKTISKWECGIGCPDVSILQKLSNFFQVNVENILMGEFQIKEYDGGNMKKIQFYVCPTCGNMLSATTQTDISCCGRKLDALNVKDEDAYHKIHVELMDDQLYVQIKHDMQKGHYISFLAYVCDESVYIKKMYAEQAAETHLPYLRRGKLYVCCSKDGLFLHKGRT